MGFLKNFLERKREREARVRRAEDDDRVLNNIERKKLSHNEREVIGFLRREKEEHLKDALRFEEQRRRTEELCKEREMFNGGGFNLLE